MVMAGRSKRCEQTNWVSIRCSTDPSLLWIQPCKSSSSPSFFFDTSQSCGRTWFEPWIWSQTCYATGEDATRTIFDFSIIVICFLDSVRMRHAFHILCRNTEYTQKVYRGIRAKARGCPSPYRRKWGRVKGIGDAQKKTKNVREILHAVNHTSHGAHALNHKENASCT